MINFYLLKKYLRHLVVFLLGVTLLIVLVIKINPEQLITGVKKIGWGICLVIVLSGVSHLIRTWAWMLALNGKTHRVSIARAFGLRLISEAIGQFGFLGIIAGDSSRVALLKTDVPTALAVSSVALDRCLFIITGAVVTVTGVLTVLIALPLSHCLRVYALILIGAMLVLPFATVFAVRRHRANLSAMPWKVAETTYIRPWMQKIRATLNAVQVQVTHFYRLQPMAFWNSVALNLISHVSAIAEVYIILYFLQVPVTFFAALIFESLTKLINVVGAINPGNLGTYEGGTIIIGKLVHLTTSQGLTLALCRRMRAIFWAVIGTFCLMAFSRLNKKTASVSDLA